MKKLSILFAAFSVLFLVSCGKYEDGPGFSLRSKEARLAGTWTFEKVTWDGIDVAVVYEDYTWDFTKSGSFTETEIDFGQIYTYVGTWALTSNDENITITDSDGDSRTYKILRLTNSEFWFSQTSNGSTDEYHLKAK